MKKLATLLLSTALVGGLTLSAYAAPNNTGTSPRYLQRGNAIGQQYQAPQGQFGNAQGVRGFNNGVRFGAGNDILRLACSVNGAPRLEIELNNLSDRMTLSAEQKTLFDAFKTSALTAQTDYADTCKLPAANTGAQPNPVENLKLYETNATARIAAIDSVLPSLEAFYNSLSDAQKAELNVGPRANVQVGQQGRFGNFNPRMDHRTMGPGNMGPNQGNFAPNQGQRPMNGQGYAQGYSQGYGPGQGYGQGYDNAPRFNNGQGIGPYWNNNDD